MTQHADDDPVTFRYDSNRNVSFHDTEESGYTWGEWREMTDKQKVSAMEELLWDLVDIYVDDEES